MSIAQMREYLSKRYDSPNWDRKLAKMSDRQVQAIYMRMIESSRNK